MRITLIYHDRCFDGAASAALLSRFLQDYYYANGTFAFHGVLHTPGFRWDPDHFNDGENAIVDFRYARYPQVTWWFDHHQSAFLAPEDEAHFEATRSRQKVLDPSYSSCTSLIADHLKREFGYVAVELDELIRWADIIDGAKYPTPEAAVDILSPAARLKLVLENAEDPSIRDFVVRKMRFRSLEEIVEEPQVKALEDRFVEDQLVLIDLLLERARRRDRVAVFDLTDTPVERYNKLMPFMMFADLDYAVGVHRMGGLIKVSLGTNPWSKSADLVNLATLAERYGGGGHSVVSGIALDSSDLDNARLIVDDIVRQLIEPKRLLDPGNGDGPGGLRAGSN